MDNRVRSLCKSITYRAINTIITTLIALVITGQPMVAAGIGIIECLVKLVIYYVHERVWHSIR